MTVSEREPKPKPHDAVASLSEQLAETQSLRLVGAFDELNTALELARATGAKLRDGEAEAHQQLVRALERAIAHLQAYGQCAERSERTREPKVRPRQLVIR